MSDGGSWAPFGPGSDDEPPPSEGPERGPDRIEDPSAPPPVEEPSTPPPVDEPVPEPPPAVTFAPPVAAPLPTLPEPTAPAALGWPAPEPSTPPAGQEAPWPPTGHLTPKPVPSSATVSLVLGITSLFCGFTGPFAIHYGLQARREQAADPSLGGRGLAAWGLGLGIVATAFLVLTLILVAAGVLVLT